MADESKILVRLRLLGGQAFNAQAKRSAAQLGTVGGSARSVASRFSGLQAGAAAAGRALRTVGVAAGALAAAGLAVGVKQSVTFEQSMANVQARLLTTGKNMDQLRGLAVELGAKTQFSAQQAADAMGELAAQGMSTRQIMQVLPGTLSLAAASGTDLADAAAIQTETLHGFGLAASQANRVADVLAQTANRSAAGIDDMQESLKYIAPVAKASGQSLEDMMAAVGLLSNVGIKGSQAGTTLRTAMVRLSNPTDKARDALAALGLSAGDLAGKKGLLSLPNIMGKVVKGAQGVSKNQRNAALATIFGRDALSGMVALVEAGSKKFDRMSDSLKRSRGAAARAAGIMRNTVAGAWDNFTGSVQTAAVSLLHRFQPAMRDALNGASSLVNQGVKALTRALGSLHRKLAPVVNALRAGMDPTKTASMTAGYRGLAGVMVRIGRAIGPIRGVLHGFTAGLDPKKTASMTAGYRGLAGVAVKVGRALRGVPGVARQVLDALKPAAPFLQNVLIPLLIGVGKGVLGSVVAAFKVAVPVIKVLAIALGAIGKIAAPLRPAIQGLGMVIGFIAAGPILKAIGGFGKLGLVARALRAPIEVANTAIRAAIGVIARLGGAFVRAFTFVQRFVGTFTGSAGRVARAALNLVGGVIDAIETLPAKGAQVASKMVSGIADGVRGRLGDLTAFFGRVGQRIIDAVVKAIKAAPGAITGAVMSIVPGPVKGAVRKTLGVVPGLAGGGVVRTPLQVVGERGPELAALPQGTRVTPAPQTRRILSSGGERARPLPQPPIELHAHLYLSGRQIHQEVFRVERQLVEAT